MLWLLPCGAAVLGLVALASSCGLDRAGVFAGFGGGAGATASGTGGAGGTSTTSTGTGGTSTSSSGTGGQGATGGFGGSGGNGAAGGAGGTGGTGGIGGGGGTGGGGGGPTCTPIGLVDAFGGTAVNQNLWNMQGQTNMFVVSNGTLEFDGSQSGVTGGWAGLVSSQNFAFQGQCVWIEVLNLHHNGMDGGTYWQLHNSQGNASFTVSGGTLELHIGTGGNPVDTTLPYSSTAHRWWRMREAGGTLYLETAPQGTVWTERLSAPSPTYLSDVVVGIGVTGADIQPIVGTTELDNLNVPPP